MQDKVNAWNIRVELDNGRASAHAFGQMLEVHCPDLDKGVAENMVAAAYELTRKSDNQRVCVVSSGHHRADGSGYIALSVCLSAPTGETPQTDMFKAEKETG